MRPLIFLDFDGVLNSRDWYERRPKSPPESTVEQYERNSIDPAAVERLNVIIARTGAEVVVSSTWRKGRTISALRGILGDRGFTGSIVGKTPCMNTRRGLEIQAWLDDELAWGNKYTFVILDDDSDMEHLMHRLVLTDHAVGLTDERADLAIKMLLE